MQYLEWRVSRNAVWGFPTCVLLVLSVMVGGCQRSSGPPKENSPAPPTTLPAGSTEPKPTAFEATGGIDPKVIAAWERAGARFGWEVPVYGNYTSKTPIDTKFVTTRPEKSPALPAFSAIKGSVRGLQDLPAPQAPFGLDLDRSPLTEADLKALARFQHLRSLRLIDTGLRNASLKDLGCLTQLQVLILAGNQISDAGLKELAGLKDLKMLSLGATDVRGPGLKELAGLQLETLRLYNFDVTDAVGQEVARLKTLRVLDLHLTKLTDAGLKDLAQLKELELLNVAVTDVTDAGLADIRKALPNCEVQR